MAKRCPIKARILAVKYKYNLNWDEFEELAKKSDYKCAICSKPLSLVAHETIETAYVDHDHYTGKVRGILCRVCNVGLGHLGDSVQHLQNAINYLKEHADG